MRADGFIVLPTLPALRVTKNVDVLLDPINGAVNPRQIAAALDRNPMLVTALAPVIGYDQAAAIAKRALAEGRPIREVAAEMTDLDEQRLAKLLDPAALTKGGVRQRGSGD